MTSDLRIPRDFQMGVATSSWQIEGDVAGRGPCIWDDFAKRPGAIADGCTGEPAAHHVARLDEDLELINWLGVDAYRFSFSWPRIFPEGSGSPSAAGLDFYDRLIDGLLKRGVSPAATLYHWDLPSVFEERGGWPIRETAERFADYASFVAQRYADRVDRWATLNEPWVSAFLGYSAGIHAPGRKEPGASLAAAYHLMLGHGLAVPRMRAAGARNVGIVLNLIPVIAESDDVAAETTLIDGLQNRLFLELLRDGVVPEDLLEACASVTDWSFVRDGDSPILSAPIDWLGENYYTVMRVGAARDDAAHAVGQDVSMFPACPPVTFAPREPRTDMGWEVFAPGIGMALRMAAQWLPTVPLWIAENGAAVPEDVNPTEVHDPLRTQYLHDHIAEVLATRADGINIRGYFAWSMLDNIEWAEGWTKRFGIIRVDEVTGVRTPKDSARWYQRQLAAREK